MLSVCTVLKLGKTGHILVVVQIFAVLKENNTLPDNSQHSQEAKIVPPAGSNL
jgi:hypothetical protein